MEMIPLIFPMIRNPMKIMTVIQTTALLKTAQIQTLMIHQTALLTAAFLMAAQTVILIRIPPMRRLKQRIQ